MGSTNVHWMSSLVLHISDHLETNKTSIIMNLILFDDALIIVVLRSSTKMKKSLLWKDKRNDWFFKWHSFLKSLIKTQAFKFKRGKNFFRKNKDNMLEMICLISQQIYIYFLNLLYRKAVMNRNKLYSTYRR